MGTPPSEQDLPQLARRQLQAGEGEAAQATMLEAIRLSPRDPAHWLELGRVLEARGELGEAVEAFLEAASLAPEDTHSRTALGHLFRNMSLPEEAIHWHGQALALQPDELILNLNHVFVLPIVPSSAAQIGVLRQRCLEGLESLLERHAGSTGEPPFQQGCHFMQHHPFYLIYHNCNDRSVLEGYGRLMRSHARSQAGSAWPWQPQHTPPRRQRRRIGFLSGYLCGHSNSLAFEGLIRNLDRRHFEVVIIHLSTTKHDDTRLRINSYADQVTEVDMVVSKSLQALRGLDLDLLYFTDIGMHAYSTLLACARCAPVQVTGWGIPQTSGLSSLDHYISAALAEPADAQDHYTEQLVRLPGLPSCYLSSNLPAIDKDRDYFFLPGDGLLLGCLQTFWKLHPDFDAVLEQIAQRVPEAWFVLVEAEVTSFTEILLERLQRAAPTLCQRLILLSRQGRDDYVSLASCMDLLLDPPYFSSGVSLYDTIHTGTPTVCLEGAFLRSRYSAAAYRLMGVTNPPVATDLDHYVELVVALAQDPLRRAALRQEIRQRAAAHLYDRLDGVEAFADFALEAIERSRSARER